MYLRKSLLAELADIERQQEDKTLPHSDQQLLDQAWENITRQLEELDQLRVVVPAEVDWRDLDAVVEEEDEDETPPPPKVTIAPPPPPARSVTLNAGLSRDGRIMAQMPDGRWVPAPFPSFAPPPPPSPAEEEEDTARICNCDADGQCAYCKEEELQRWNNMEDDREGCERCSGCYYCRDGPGYDGADEI